MAETRGRGIHWREADRIVEALRTTSREAVAVKFGRALGTINRIARAHKIKDAA